MPTRALARFFKLAALDENVDPPAANPSALQLLLAALGLLLLLVVQRREGRAQDVGTLGRQRLVGEEIGRWLLAPTYRHYLYSGLPARAPRGVHLDGHRALCQARAG